MNEKQIHDIERISDLLYKEITGSLTDEERQELKAWINASPQHATYVQHLHDPAFLEEEYQKMKAVDVEKAWERMVRMKEERQPRSSHLSFLKLAAAILVLIVGGALLWYAQYTKVTPPEISQEVLTAMEMSKKSGKQGAIVDLAVRNEEGPRAGEQNSGMRGERDEDRSVSGSDGQDQGRSSKYMEEDPATTLLPPPASFTKEQLLSARRVTTQHDKEFWVTLDDGTLVHLNYNTRLIYPEKFGRGDRSVVLDGEAYFMVAKDRSRPFVVHTPDGSVRVYGTEFNVNTKGTTSVVLVKGSVSVTPTDGKEQMMKPGQQCAISASGTHITAVDVTPFIAWNTGMFVFENSTLDQLMHVMAQWYGIREVVFKDNSIRQIHFTGSLQRYGGIDRLIQAISAVCDVNIRQQDDRLIIQRK